MRKKLKLATAAALLASPAMAVTNLENPLYMPMAGEVYSRTGLGLMYVRTNDNAARVAHDHVHATEFPIYRVHQDLGVGLTDFLSLRGTLSYTHNGDIDRTGISNARLGLNFRASEFVPTHGITWDIYADAQLGGVSKMKAEAIAAKGGADPITFDYDNYSNGRWGAWLGTKVGKTWDRLTVAAYAEVLRTFGNDNNEINVGTSGKQGIANAIAGSFAGTLLEGAGGIAIGNLFADNFPEQTISVETGSTWEYAAGLRSLYQLDSRWSFGGGLHFRHRPSNVVKNVGSFDLDTLTIQGTLDVMDANPPFDGALAAHDVTAENLAAGLVDYLENSLRDRIDEYILSAVVAHQLTNNVQVALYGEYTFNSAAAKSQNATDIKAELGARVNVRF
ncbi:MAG: hypothetical protein FWE17_00760 [Alphaproteobacteria bacterium]|nr:hypothetical protein [Alphaproteobacteria bacterium]MCL2758181.1 hypothetical protein [Alphaproteobacteria bacterium]